MAYRPMDESPVPGMTPADFARLQMPVLILRSGVSDCSHTRETSEWVHGLIPGSVLIDPPWGDTEWNERRRTVLSGEMGGLFVNWPLLAPTLLEFLS